VCCPECLKLPRHVLPTLVIPQSAQFRSSDILSPSLELLECSKGLRFLLKEVNCIKARVVIKESDPVVIPLMCGDLHRAMDIAVDELEQF
jgi:hypothetical protein